MPRQPDPDLQERILNAAQKLWKKGAEKTLTMRAVARAAGTNTPAVYRRFQNRQDILRALLQRIQQDVLHELQSSESPEQACERYLEFAVNHAHEYELFYLHAHELSRPVRANQSSPLRENRPTMQLMEQRLAERLGGKAEDHTRLSLALWTMAHGTAMLLISKAIPAGHVSELRSVFTSAVTTLINNSSSLSMRN